MFRWQRFNKPPAIMEDARRSYESDFAYQIRDLGNLDNPHLALGRPIATGVALALIAHLGYPSQKYPAPDALKIAVHAAQELFFGNWRERWPMINGVKQPPDRIRSVVWWVDGFRYGILASCILEDEPALKRIASYLDEDLPIFDVLTCKGKDCQLWQILLAKSLRGVSPDEFISARNLLLAARPSKRTSLLLESLEGLLSETECAFAEAFMAYMRHFRDREFKGVIGPEFVSIEGSILWHVAAKRGKVLPDLARVVTKKPVVKVKRPGVKVPELETSLADYILFPKGISS